MILLISRMIALARRAGCPSPDIARRAAHRQRASPTQLKRVLHSQSAQFDPHTLTFRTIRQGLGEFGRMKFGKLLQDVLDENPGMGDYFISYKRLKKVIKSIAQVWAEKGRAPAPRAHLQSVIHHIWTIPYSSSFIATNYMWFNEIGAHWMDVSRDSSAPVSYIVTT